MVRCDSIAIHNYQYAAIVNFAPDIGIGVIAQGVEAEQQRDLLTSTDTMTQAQG